MNRWVIGLGLLLLALLAWLLLAPKSPPTSTSASAPGTASQSAEQAAIQNALGHASPGAVAAIDSAFAPAKSAVDAAVRQSVVPVPPSEPTAALFTNLPPAAVMENVSRAIHDYGARFGGNPVGTNPEIARALRGDNSRQVNFLDESAGVRVNDRGELVDPWGVPFFLHQLSAREMEIRSAGPDRRLWTDDDLVVR